MSDLVEGFALGVIIGFCLAIVGLTIYFIIIAWLG